VPSRQPDSFRQFQLVPLHFFLGLPRTVIFWMLLAVEFEAARGFLDQADPPTEGGAFGAAEFEAFANFLDGQVEDQRLILQVLPPDRMWPADV